MLIQAIVLGVICYIAALGVPWVGTTGGFYTLSRPLISGMVVGLVLGDVQSGIIVGVAVQALYLSLVVPGGVAAADITFVGYPAIALAILSGADPQIAVTLAASIGLLGAVLFSFMEVINSFWNHVGDRYASEGNFRGVILSNIVYPQITTFIIRFVPTFIAVYYGSQYAQQLLESIPQTIIHIMSVLGGILPAVGIAMIFVQSMKDNSLIIYYLVGFTLMVFFNLNMIGLAIIGSLFAIMNYNFKKEDVSNA